jgi:hypothetical protein
VTTIPIIIPLMNMPYAFCRLMRARLNVVCDGLR